jgi:TFIIF-interacting CTD phosphatase-like protein
MKKNTLIILDLDHTLIYGSYAASETANFLFSHNKYLKIYERPLARTLVNLCQEKADIIVFTTALRSYAKRICKQLDINPIELLSRKNCQQVNGQYKKQVKDIWKVQYNKIIVIDDSPNVWKNSEDEHIKFIVPDEFRGDKDDFGLKGVIKSCLQLN